MLKYESNTSYFEASSAWVQFLDGSTALCPSPSSSSSSSSSSMNDDNNESQELAVRFGAMPIGHFLQLYKADQDPSGYMEQEMHVYMEPYPPWKLYPNDDEPLYIWEFNTNWYTPSWRWEWIFWRQLPGKANLPAGYDLLQCHRLDFSNGLPSKPPARMILNDVLIGTYLNTTTTLHDVASPENNQPHRRIYRPCGNHGTCRIIANHVYCGGLPPTWEQLAPFRPLLFALVSVIVLYRLRRNKKKKKQ